MGVLDLFKKQEELPVVEAPKYTILVVDDDLFIRESYQDMLTRQGYEVHTATNGQEAIEAIKQKKPQTILLDIMMPVMDGLEVLRILWEDDETRKIPVIVLTNAGDLNNMDRAKFYSAYRFFVKANVPPEELLKTVREALALSKQQTTSTTQ